MYCIKFFSWKLKKMVKNKNINNLNSHFRTIPIRIQSFLSFVRIIYKEK